MDYNLISNYCMRSDDSLQKEALAYFERLKNDALGWQLCADSLLNCVQLIDESGVFFCFQVIEYYIKNRYEDDNDENRSKLRQFIFSWFTSNNHTSNYILNKFAYIVNSVFLVDFPRQKWNTFFTDFLGVCHTQQNCDLFLRILLQINGDVAEREIPRSPKEMERNTLIKDVMRETCLLDLAQFWFNIINNYRETAASTVCLCLDVIGAYVAWIEISLITNELFMNNLFNLFSNPTFRCSVTDCFSSIIHKGMDSIAKTQLIEQFMNVESIKVQLIEICNSQVTDESDEDYLYLVKFSKLMNVIGIELIESFKKLKTTKLNANLNDGNADDTQAMTFVSSAIESKFVILCQFLSHKNNYVSIQIHPFAREYIQWTKNNLTLKSGNKSSIQIDSNLEDKLLIFLRIIIEKCKYSVDYDFSNDEETNFDEFRKSCKILFDNLMLINSSIVINFICSHLIEPTLVNWRSNNYSFSEVEIALYYFYLIGENLNFINDQKKIEALLQLMITSSISTFSHCSTQSLYFDLILRYEKYFSNNLNYLVPQILISFLDERGFKNQNPKMRSKVSHIFNKFVKSQIKSKGNDKQQNFTEDILKRLQDFLKLDITCDRVENGLENKCISKNEIPSIFNDVRYQIKQEDQLYIFETAAILIITNNNFDVTKKQYLLKNLLLQPIWNRFEEIYAQLHTNTTMNGVNDEVNQVNKSNNLNDNDIKRDLCDQIAHVINLASRTSKGFSNVQTVKSIGAQSIYLQSLNLFIKALSLNVNEELLCIMQSATRQFLHRLIVCLDESEIVPILPSAIQSLFLANQQLNAKTIQELVPLINQIITKFKHNWLFQRDLMPFIKQVFLPLVSSFFDIISNPNLANDERLALQKSYYVFLSVLVMNNIMDVFQGLNNQVMEQILYTVFQGSIDFPDAPTQKTCFQILRKFVECFGSSNSLTNGNANGSMDHCSNLNSCMIGPAFAEFIYKSIVPACFIAPLRQNDDSQMLNECLLCLKAVLQCRGNDEFTAFLQTQLFPQHFPNYSNPNGLIQALISNDIKITKNALKEFFLQFKSKQT